MGTFLELSALTLATITFHSTAQLAAVDQAPKLASTLPLPDVVHSLVDDSKRHEWQRFSEQLLRASIAFLGVSTLASKSVVPLQRFTFLANVAFMLRSLCMASTVLPDASQCCTVNIPFSITKTGLKSGSCHDLMFSGHVSMTTLAALVAADYLPAPMIAKSVAASIIVSQVLAVSASRNHYTVDALVALIVCKLLTMV
jgi:hypothetical protein